MIILNLDRVMKARKVKLKDLAVKIGLTDANLSNIKTGKISAIRFSTLNALCKELVCQPADILEYQPE
ncbi:MAG: helix-turn-helix transcriptional regulator [Clostridia bacterium]|nr:helix-turn-helix transcriptional regulator [Clostridia bacterium]